MRNKTAGKVHTIELPSPAPAASFSSCSRHTNTAPSAQAKWGYSAIHSVDTAIKHLYLKTKKIKNLNKKKGSLVSIHRSDRKYSAGWSSSNSREGSNQCSYQKTICIIRSKSGNIKYISIGFTSRIPILDRMFRTPTMPMPIMEF